MTSSNDYSIGISSPSKSRDEVRGNRRSSFAKLASFTVKSLGLRKNVSSRDLSDSTSTIDTDLSQSYDWGDLSISSLLVNDDDQPVGNDNHDAETADTDDAEYTVPLNDSSAVRTCFIHESRSCPYRKEILMDDYVRALREEEPSLVGLRGDISILHHECAAGEDYNTPVGGNFLAGGRLWSEASRNPDKFELLMDSFEWKKKSYEQVSVNLGEIERLGRDDDEESVSQAEILYTYYHAMMQQ